LNPRAIDRNPKIRFNHVLQENQMKLNDKYLDNNLQYLKRFPSSHFQYKNQSVFDVLPEYP